jgi:hypothetical protein
MKNFILIFILLTSNIFSQNLKKNELLIPYRDGNLWGFCDTLGVVKVKPFVKYMGKFTIDSDFMGSYIIKNNNKFSIINQYKKTLLHEIDVDSLEISNFSNEILVYKNNKVGLLKDFKSFIPIEYDNISLVANESFSIRKNGKAGLINSKGKMIIPAQYSYIGWPREENKDQTKFDWVAFTGFDEEKIFTDDKVLEDKKPKLNSGYTVYASGESREEYDKRQNEYKKIEKLYGEIVSVSGDFVIIKNGKQHRVYSMSKSKFILENDDIIDTFPSNHGYFTFSMKKNNKFGLIDEAGKVLLDFAYDKIKYKLNGICLIEKDGKKGLFILNSIYKTIEPKYKEIKILEPVSINNHWQFGLFEVTTTNDKKGLLGENGIEYFKN